MARQLIEALKHPLDALYLSSRTGFTLFDPLHSRETLQREILRAENDRDTLPPGFARQIVEGDLESMIKAGKKLGLL